MAFWLNALLRIIAKIGQNTIYYTSLIISQIREESRYFEDYLEHPVKILNAERERHSKLLA
jgi:hypothetical protein